MLLSGTPPFNGKNQKELFRLIRKGKFEFHQQFWGDISDDAKDLVSKLLTVDPNSRYTAQQALNSPWVQGAASTLSTRDLGSSLVQFRKFNAKRKLKQAVLAVSFASFKVSSVQSQFQLLHIIILILNQCNIVDEHYNKI